MKRGDIVIAALRGDSGKPRPAVIIQSNRLVDVDSVRLCPIRQFGAKLRYCALTW
jgi:mRNA interferase MazF